MIFYLPRTLHQQDDNTLLRKVRKGNKRAFETLYDRHWKAVFAYVYNRLHDRDASEEIVAELFLDLWGQRQTIATALSDHLLENAKRKLLEHIKNTLRGGNTERRAAVIRSIDKFHSTYTGDKP